MGGLVKGKDKKDLKDDKDLKGNEDLKAKQEKDWRTERTWRTKRGFDFGMLASVQLVTSHFLKLQVSMRS